jgi:hypothetical protein
MFRCGIILKNGEYKADNFDTKEKCETWILENMEISELKKSVIVNKNNISERYVERF